MNKTLDYSPISCKYCITVLECFASIKHMQTFFSVDHFKNEISKPKISTGNDTCQNASLGARPFLGGEGRKV